MPTNFALPVGHLVQTPVTRGRPFRQPLAPPTNTTVAGLELLVPDVGEGASLYACVNGDLAWLPAAGGLPNRLVLHVNEFTAAPSLRAVRVFEAAPFRLMYENVDQAKVRSYLIAVLTNAYDDAKKRPTQPKTWHPAMREVSQGAKFKQIIDDNGVGEIDKRVDKFLNSNERFLRVEVLAGERIGAALPKQPGAPAGHSHSFILHMIDTGSQHINPLYYLHLYTRSPVLGPLVTVITNLTGHPFIAAFPELQAGTPRPRPREPVGAQDHFPLGELMQPQDVLNATVKWSYNTSEKFTVNGTELVPDNDATTGVDRLWQNSGDDLQRICRIMQIPCEVATAIFAAESSGNPRVYRFEPLQRKAIEAAQSRPDLVAMYEEVLGSTVTSFTASPLAAAEELGKDVVTSLNVVLDEPRRFGQDALKGRNPSVLSIERAYRPIVVSNSAPPPGQTSTREYRLEIKEERLVRQISHADVNLPFYHPAPDKVDPQRTNAALRAASAAASDINYQSDRGGRVRVMRAQAATPVPFDVTIRLVAPAQPPLDVTIPANAPNAFQLNGTLDIAKNDAVVIEVQASGPVELSVEWFLGVGTNTPMSLTGVGGKSSHNTGLNPIPVPWVTGPTAKIRPGREMSWDQLLELIDLTGGPFMSPGISQTLINTAAGTIRQINRIDSGLLALLGIAPPTTDPTSLNENKTLKDMLRGTTAEQEAAGAARREGWLLIPKNAVLAGLGKLRTDYNRTPGKFDLPRMVNLYFQGGVNIKLTKDRTRWGMTLPDPEWVDIVGRRYNAAVTKFNAGSSPPATVRFKP